MKVSYIQISTFLNLRGWVDTPNNYNKNVSLFTNFRFPSRQLWLPKSEEAPDFKDSVDLLLSKLSLLESKSSYELMTEIERTNHESTLKAFDVFSLRMLNSNVADEDGIPLRLAATSISETEILLMTSRCQAEAPQVSYRRIDNKLSNNLIKNAIFNHTQKGSFILNISCGLLEKGENLPLIDDPLDWTATRKTFISMNRSITTLKNVMEENRVVEFTNDLLSSKSPLISSNFCEALGNLMINSIDPIEFSFNWSPFISLPDDINKNSKPTFEHSSAYVLYDISRGLLPEEESRFGEFFGTVEALRGDLNSGEREGWVELLITFDDRDSPVRASAYLDSNNYKLADEAHIAGAQKLKIVGKLDPRPRVWNFSEIKDVSIVRS